LFILLLKIGTSVHVTTQSLECSYDRHALAFKRLKVLVTELCNT